MALTARQAMFVQEYLISLNATQAAIRAGYSEKTARAIGSENLKKPAIAAEIANGKAGRRKRLEDRADHTIHALAQVAFSSLADVLGKDGKLLPLEEWPPDVWAGVQSVRTSSRTGTKNKRGHPTGVRMQNKVKALGLLLKLYGYI
jgi:phage terminase small subunit